MSFGNKEGNSSSVIGGCVPTVIYMVIASFGIPRSSRWSKRGGRSWSWGTGRVLSLMAIATDLTCRNDSQIIPPSMLSNAKATSLVGLYSGIICGGSMTSTPISSGKIAVRELWPYGILIFIKIRKIAGKARRPGFDYMKDVLAPLFANKEMYQEYYALR